MIEALKDKYEPCTVLQETYKWKQSAGAGLTYEEFRDHFGCDGAIWNEVWKEEQHGYKWRTEEGDLRYTLSPKKEDADMYGAILGEMKQLADFAINRIIGLVLCTTKRIEVRI